VLAEAGYRAIAFDRPPYGLSAKTGATIPYSPGALADFTAQVMDALDIESAVLVGQSQGGAVIGHFALRHPERAEKLAFVSAALRPSDDPPAAGGGGAPGFPPIVSTLLKFPPLERWARLLIRAFITPDFSTQILRSAYYDPAFLTPEVAEGYARQLRVVGWDEALLNQLKGSVFTAEPITADQIASINVPAMIVWGEADTWVPISVGERLRELLLESIWHTYASVGHLPQEEAAESFNADLLAFLSE
jgi:pimeloyl-ACP methyl ester carboxylesterase